MYTISFAQAGLMIMTYTVGGATAASYQLAQIDSYGAFDVDADLDPLPDNMHLVCIRQGEHVRPIDIRTIDAPVYATTQDFVDDLNTAIAAIS